MGEVWSRLVPLPTMPSGSSTICRKGSLSFRGLLFHPRQASVGHLGVNLFLVSLLCPIDLCVSPSANMTQY